MNRHWRETNPWAQPGLHSIKTYLVQLEKEAQVDFCIDIHAHSLASGAFMYGNVVESADEQLDQARGSLMINPKIPKNSKI